MYTTKLKEWTAAKEAGGDDGEGDDEGGDGEGGDGKGDGEGDAYEDVDSPAEGGSSASKGKQTQTTKKTKAKVGDEASATPPP